MFSFDVYAVCVSVRSGPAMLIARLLKTFSKRGVPKVTGTLHFGC